MARTRSSKGRGSRKWRSIPGFPGYKISIDGGLIGLRGKPLLGHFVKGVRLVVLRTKDGRTSHRNFECLLSEVFDLDAGPADEVWKRVPFLDGYYASNKGRLRGRRKGKSLSPYKTKKGYLRAQVRLCGEDVKFFVHSLVAFTFLADRWFPGAQVNHKDGDKLNNCVDNLEWATGSENVTHAFRVLGRKTPWARKINLEAIEDDLASGMTQYEVAEKWGFSRWVVKAIRAGTHWQQRICEKVRLK